MRGAALRLLLLEDSAEDAELLVEQLLQRGRFELAWQRVESRDEFERLVDHLEWDLVIAGGALPQIPAAGVVEGLRKRGLDLPFIVVSESPDERSALDARRMGADECVSRSDPPAVVDAVERCLRKFHARRARRRAERDSSRILFRTSLDWLQRIQARDPDGGAAALAAAAPVPAARPASGHDMLTRLPLRQVFSDRLAQSIEQSARAGQLVAVAFVDLDHFKSINDRLGHAVGDQLLRVVAERLQASLRRQDTVARWGGDQFVLLLPGIGSPDDAARVAAKIRHALRAPLVCLGHRLHATASIGISVFPGDGQDAATLLDKADAALYRAKEGGRDGYRLFAPAMQARAFERLSMEQGLSTALDRSELVLHYQPVADLETGEMTAVEALVRWKHPDLGLLLPARFLEVVEQTALMTPVGEWILRTALSDAWPWLRGSLQRVSVNVSVQQVLDEAFPACVSAILGETGVAPGQLELELSEPALTDSDEVARAVVLLKATGVRIALDDLGLGPSALGAFRRLPLDTVKVDCAALRDGREGPEVVRALLTLGRNLGLRVVAEGVETERQLEFLREHGCAEVQGYVVGREVPAPALDALLQSGAPLLSAARRGRMRSVS
jgi:diguanylate cyclase (GGDEF)-like protein